MTQVDRGGAVFREVAAASVRIRDQSVADLHTETALIALTLVLQVTDRQGLGRQVQVSMIGERAVLVLRRVGDQPANEGCVPGRRATAAKWVA